MFKIRSEEAGYQASISHYTTYQIILFITKHPYCKGTKVST